MFVKTKLLYPILVLIAAINLLGCNSNKTAPQPTATAQKIQQAAANSYLTADQSPLDISYYPPDYPVKKMNNPALPPPVARVVYSRPHKNNRLIFSDKKIALCEYGKPWRLGANEATEITFFKNVIISGNNVAMGTYTLYCIPEADKWTIVFNSNLNTWGLHMQESMDLFKIEIPVMQQTPAIEDFTMVFEDAADGANLIMAWDVVKTKMPIYFPK